MKPSKKESSKKTFKKVVANNKKAYHDYFVLEKIEAGVVLVGSEVKSIRAGNVSLKESYVRVFNDELWLSGCHIMAYKQAGKNMPDPVRERKLLVHKKEMLKMVAKTAEKGLTLVPLSLYFLNQRVKIEVGVCQAKKHFDKRKVLKEKTIQREIDRGVGRV